MALFLATRLAFGGFLLLTSVYCLLFYIPFTYFGFIHHPLMSWLPVFVRIHSYLFAGLVVAVSATLTPAMRAPETRRSARAFVVIYSAVALYLLLRPALGAMLRDVFAYVWSLLALFPLIWLAAIDLETSRRRNASRSALRANLRLSTACLAAIVVAFVFAGSASLRLVRHSSTVAGVPWREIAGSLVLHLVLFAAFGVVVEVIRWAACRTSWSQQTYSAGIGALACLIGAEFIRKLILPTISFDGIQASIFSGVMSLTLVLWAAATAARLRADTQSEESNRKARRRVNLWIWPLAVAALLTASYAIPVMIGPTDWDFVLQRSAVLVVWAATLGFLAWSGAELCGTAAKRTMIAVLVLAAATLGTYEAVAASHPGVQEAGRSALEDYAGSDISFKTAYDIVSRSVNNEAHQDFYRFLKHNTNLGPEVAVGPVDTDLVPDLKPTPGKKPNIFIFVIDSLRQDYVEPYNPAATWAPQLGAFARDSVVMQNAFTRYAGTALSEPAIWVGALQLHKQYIEPFYPMNNLQKLINVEGYRSYISVDPILKAILKPSPGIVELDKQTKLWSDLDLISTLKELEAKLDTRLDPEKPIFVYTQPQNVHTLTLERLQGGGSRRDISIRELHKLDTAFGEFLQFLKDRDLYDNSIIIVTSDHGDAYGEFGRYGHADFLFPEVIRIPLIIHLPSSLRSKFVYNPKQIAFSIDITPSLYYLLGHHPTRNNDLFGRPLFTETQAEQAAYERSQYLIASSYAPVYGLLRKNGDSLFIVDAVNQRNYFYDLAQDPRGVHNRVTPQVRSAGETQIRQDIGELSRFYHFVAPAN